MSFTGNGITNCYPDQVDNFISITVLSAECGLIHSRPFGNWGVELNFYPGARRDGFQFSGWRAAGGWLQWNSCTTEPEFAPGDARYYNDDGFRSQRAWPDIVNASHALRAYQRGHAGQDCEALTERNRIVVNRVGITIYELDPVTADAVVATLSYGTVEIPYHCGGPWDCVGESKWMEPASGDDDVYAELRLAVHLRKEE